METINDKIVTFLNPKTIEPAAKQQLENIAELPFVVKHVAVMPDCHLGKGADGRIGHCDEGSHHTGSRRS